MDPSSRQEILDALAAQRDGSLASFFTAHGLGDAYESPGRGWGRQKKIAAALAAARRQGREESVLLAAAERFGPAQAAVTSQPAPLPQTANVPGKPRMVFISHLGSEKGIALRLKDLISGALPKSEIFVSSDPGSIPPGERWVDRITDALRRCDSQIVVASPASIGRPWINFEAGTQWIRPIPVIPLCHSGMAPSILPLPLSLLQAGMLTSAIDLESTVRAIARTVGQEPLPADYDTAARDLRAIEADLVADGVSTLATPTEQINRPIPDLRALSPERRALERDLYDRILELQTLRAEGLRPRNLERLTRALGLIGRFWTEPQTMSDTEVANATEDVSAVIDDMRTAGRPDLERRLLEVLYRRDLEQAVQTHGESAGIDEIAAELEVSREALSRRLRALAAAGLVEILGTAGAGAEGSARITEAGREEIEDQG